jgi:hypothetical protein
VTVRIGPVATKVPSDCQVPPAAMMPEGSACWLIATVPRVAPPLAIAYGASVARSLEAVHVAATL